MNAKQAKQVLEEDEYIDNLEKIIERDFYPDLSKLKKETMDEQEEEKQPSKAVQGMTLNKFVDSFTSEDNASFSKLQEKSQEDHRRRYDWAFAEERGINAGPARTRLSEQRLSLMESACASKPEVLKDSRQNSVDSWPFQAENSLLFYPEAAAQPNDQKNEIAQRLTQGRSRIGKPVRRAATTMYENSRFIVHGSGEKQATPIKSSTGRYSTVEMTPCPSPNASPFLTWGSIESTPLILNPNLDRMEESGKGFQLAPTSHREEIASKLGSVTRFSRGEKRRTLERQKADRSRQQTQRSLSRTFGHLTPQTSYFRTAATQAKNRHDRINRTRSSTPSLTDGLLRNTKK